MSNPIKFSELFEDDGGLDKLIKKLSIVEETYKNINATVRKGLQGVKAETEKLNVANDSQNEQIKKNEKATEVYVRTLQDLEEAEKEIQETKKRATKLAKEEQRLLKKRNELTEEAALENAKLKVEISELNKELKQQAREAKGLVGEYEKQSKLLISLRKRYKDLAAAGKENSDESRELLEQVTKLDARLKEIDKSVGQTQREVGNYKDQVKEALEETNLWGEGLAGAIDKSGMLGDVISKLTAIMSFLTKAKDADEEQTKANVVVTKLQDKATKSATITQRAFARAQLFTARASRVLGKALKATGIGLVIAALGGLVAVLSKTQSGIDGLSKVTESLGQVFEVLVRRLASWGAALVGFFTGIGKGITEVVTAISEFRAPDFSETTDEFAKSLENLKNVFAGLVDEIGKAIEQGTKIAEMEAARRLNAIKLREEIAKLNAEAARGEEIEGDNTKSFEERKDAIIAASRAQEEASRKQVQLIKEEIAVIEERQRLAREQVKDEEALQVLLTTQREELSEKTVELIEAEGEAVVRQLALRRVANQLEQDLIEKNLDILIDGFDNQKTINEQLIADEKKKFNERVEILNKTKKLREISLKEQEAEIQRFLDNQFKQRQIEAKKEGKILDDSARKQININELLGLSNAKELNDRIRKLEASEIIEGRILEIVRDGRTAIQDLDTAEEELKDSRAAFLKETIRATEELRIANENNINVISELEEEARFEREKAEIESNLKLYDGDIKATKELNKRKEQLEIQHQKNLNEIRLNSFVDEQDRELKELELSLLKKGEKQEDIDEKLKEARIEALDEEIKEIEQINKESAEKGLNLKIESIDQELELARLKSQKEKDIEKKKFDEFSELRDTFINGSIDAFSEKNEREIALIDKQTEAQQDAIERQRKLAEDGVANTLAFEEAELAKLELKKQQAERERIRLEKIKALYASYSAAASSGDNNAVAKAIRDFALLEGITAGITSFGEGTGKHGTISDAIDARTGGSKNGNSLRKGMFRGESHAKRGHGIQVLVEGGEGILSTKQMSALGSDNFMRLTSALDEGVLGSDIFGSQIGQVPAVNTFNIDLSGLRSEMNDVKKAIENKPVQQVDVDNLSKSYTDFIDTKITGNKKVISRYRVNKKRI